LPVFGVIIEVPLLHRIVAPLFGIHIFTVFISLPRHPRQNLQLIIG